ncbi:uncharacterized protein LOC130899143 isoform X1 [Diorhabda carinulata]|uniref:uncharacterized protein LOC130899143 isoform X1 n=2 Tax=Diorhabda carinulata TaxID=1163345 RepID=UPI0025A24319|nr:uncharacterized protein LOC130899143 isoform X1 [Diorhabda carinulata]
MRRSDGEEYKEGVVKTLWNTVAKILQQKCYEEFNIIFDPFKDVTFECARTARDAKRKQLQKCPEKRKTSASSLSGQDIDKMCAIWDESTPDGLQRKFFHIASYELAWRGGEACNCLLSYFEEEFDNYGNPTGRIAYNPIFSKTAQGGSHRLTEKRWLVQNTTEPDKCPIRLFKMLKEKRGKHITVDRLFLTVNPSWMKETSKGFFKNCPVGRNEISKWTRDAAEAIGIDTKRIKVTNHSNRAAAVTQLAKVGVSENQIMKVTGHSNQASIKSYLQVNSEHHEEIVQKMRNDSSEVTIRSGGSSIETPSSASSKVVYSNCIFNNCSFS